MEKIIEGIRNFVLKVIDFFHPPFKEFIPILTFRYAATGGGNIAINYLVYYVTYRWILKGQNLDIGIYEFKSHVAALFFAVCVSWPIGFFMAKYVVFTDSGLRGRVQFFRYFMVCTFNLLLNYLLLKILVEIFHVYPTIAQIITVVVITIFSYLAQRHYTFKVKPDDIDEDNY